MNTSLDIDLLMQEDQLPPWQPPIETASLKQFRLHARLLMESRQKTGYSTMGVVTGRAGVGKSIAVQAFLQSQASQSHTGLPACIGMRLAPDATPKRVVEELLSRLGERIRRSRSTRFSLADEAARAIMRNDIQLLLIDEIDQLDEAGFELLRYIYGKTGCPILIVGLRTILPILDRRERFSSRTRLRMDFLPPSDEEVFSTVLPQLVFPCWHYTPSNQEDRIMGEQLWAHVKPSFRDLRVVLQLASQYAEIVGSASITPAILEQVYPLIGGLHQGDMLQQETALQELTEYELISQQRRDAKRKEKSA